MHFPLARLHIPSVPVCVPSLFDCFCTATISSGERNSESRVWYCCETLELVVELAEVCPAFLRPRVSQCVAGMVQVCMTFRALLG